MGKEKRDRIGEGKYNNFGSYMIITEYENCGDITVYFPDYNWYNHNVCYSDFKKGKIGCPYEPRTYCKGYVGDGKYKTRDDNGDITKIYRLWHDMMKRCYSEKYIKANPTYEKCYVCDEWLNYQNFAKWFEDNYYEVPGERMELDKDILYKGNKRYGPDTCIITPHRINALFIRRESMRNGLPIGVRKEGDRYTYNVSGYNTKSMLFDTPIEAFYEYKRHKEQLIKNLAEKYKHEIPEKLYKALCEYKVNIDD